MKEGIVFKGKLFNLLPMKNGFTISNIPFSSNTMGRMLLTNKLIKKLTGGYGTPEEVDNFWRKFFNVNLVETKYRRFGYMIITDGCSVSVKMQHFENLKGSSQLSDEDFKSFYESGICKTIGIDPGVSKVITGIDNERRIVSYSSGRYYEKSKVFLSQKLTTKWNEETADLIAEIPTSKTSDVQTIKEFARKYLEHIETLLMNRMSKGYRNIRFMRYVNKQKAINEICDMIAPEGNPVIVGFGNWSGVGRTPISRRCSGPVKEIKKELSQRSNVKFIEIDEFRTSCRCSCCHRPMVKMKAFTCKKQCDGTSLRSATKQRIHSVLHCTNSDCVFEGRRMGTMNRDVNGSINIHMLLLRQLDGLERPLAFRRGSG
jgi:hypothetical protein